MEKQREPFDQIAYSTAYTKAHSKQMCLRFYESEYHLYDYLKSISKPTAYMKQLVRDDMKKKGIEK